MDVRSPPPQEPHRVVIVGGGFGGLYCAQAFRRSAVDVTLVDKRNFHLFQPLLYQVATGSLSPGEIASPLRGVLKRQKNTRVLLAEVVDIDPVRRRVVFSDGEAAYDTLIVATGASHHYFGNQQWAPFAPGLKTVEDATEIRRRLLLAFEAAERAADADRRRAWLTFVLVGGGATGVELAGALGEIARHTLKADFRAINPADARILLVEADARILPPYPPKLSAKAAAQLGRLGVTVLTNTRVTAIDAESVTLLCAGASERITTRTVLWAAGVQASPPARLLEQRAGAQLDRAGRVVVAPDCSVPGYPNIFVIGDLACCSGDTGTPLPGVAPVAMQQGRYVARRIQQQLRGDDSGPFHYHDRGMLAVIGRGAAVARIGGLQLSGFPAWLVWVFIHIMQLVEYDNRVLVFVQWAMNYFTWNRGARLMTGEPSLPLRR